MIFWRRARAFGTGSSFLARKFPGGVFGENKGTGRISYKPSNDGAEALKRKENKTMTMKKLEKILEDEIKACEEHCETYKSQGFTTLWEISDVRRQTCEDILKKIREA